MALVAVVENWKLRNAGKRCFTVHITMNVSIASCDAPPRWSALISTITKQNCHETGPGSGRYDFYRKKSPLKGLLKLADHWFVEYRGFVYEFGSAGYQELDINDPNYKYGPGREKVTAEDLQGTSSCTRDEVTTFIDKWLELNPNYHLIANNCQDFAKAVINELRSNCPHRVKRQADESLKAQCSAALSCTFFLNWKLYALLGPVVAFAMSS